MGWLETHRPGDTLVPGKLQCCICKAVTKHKYWGKKGARDNAGAVFKDNKTHGEVKCPRCHGKEGLGANQRFEDYWMHALPENPTEPDEPTEPEILQSLTTNPTMQAGSPEKPTEPDEPKDDSDEDNPWKDLA